MRIFEVTSGLPSPLYHGTSANFERFAAGRSIHRQTSLGGFSFTSDPRSAWSYALSAARLTGGRPRLVTANLDMRNPLDITDVMAKLMRRRKMLFGDAKRFALQAFDPAVHDGIVFRGNAMNKDEYVVFNPDQIDQPSVVPISAR